MCESESNFDGRQNFRFSLLLHSDWPLKNHTSSSSEGPWKNLTSSSWRSLTALDDNDNMMMMLMRSMIAVWDTAFVYHCFCTQWISSVNVYHMVHEDHSFITCTKHELTTVSRGNLRPKSWQQRQINSPCDQPCALISPAISLALTISPALNPLRS